MALSAPAAARTAAGLVFLLLIPLAAAQAPPDPQTFTGSVVGFVVTAQKSSIDVGYLSGTQVPIIVRDLSRDGGQVDPNSGGSVGVLPHSVTLTVLNLTPSDYQGWQVLVGHQFIPLAGGQTFETSLLVQTTPAINVDEIAFDLLANYTGPGGVQQTQTLHFVAQVNPYGAMFARITNPTAKAGQFDVVNFDLMISNQAVYPDTFTISARADKPEFRVVVPGSVYVGPLETRHVNISVLTPKGKFYEFGLNSVVTAQVESSSGLSQYTAVGVIQTRGFHIPVYWFPLLLVGVVSAAIVTRAGSERLERNRLAKGEPRRVQLTPRQEILLAELKRRDPEAYKARREQLAAIYKERRTTYKGARKERLARDREQRKTAIAEMKVNRARMKAEEKAAKKQRALEKKAAKKQAKLDKKQAKIEAKALKKEAKILGKKRAKLEKQKAKLDKKAEKQAAKDAKAQAKADKAAAKQAKADAKAAKKRDKAR